MWLFAQDDGSGGGYLQLGVILVIAVLNIAAWWVIYAKAGKPGWASLIPIYNIYVLTEIVGRPILWFILMLVPCINAFVGLILLLDLAKSFGKSVGFGILMWLLAPIMVPVLAFGGATYVGPAAAQS